ncbi:hypothetical protein B0H19DRAFT_1075666 [Mycena capillaripes]|nr:hypothetical protein B0H19DRAFT_1075666 [Mycena capillaripes]
MAKLQNTLISTALPPNLPGEMILQIFAYLTDAELLSLASMSKQFHTLALLSYLARYGINETNISNNSYPLVSTSGAFRALCIARFVGGIDALRVRFDPSTKTQRDVRLLDSLVSRLPPINSVELEFLPRSSSWERQLVGSQCDLEGLMFRLISQYRSRPSVIVCPKDVTVLHTPNPLVHYLKRIVWCMPINGSKTYIKKRRLIYEKQFRLTMEPRLWADAGATIPTISLRRFDPPAAFGTVFILDAPNISRLHLWFRTSKSETAMIFDVLSLPRLLTVDAEVSGISDASMHRFLCRHPSLKVLDFYGPPCDSDNVVQRQPLPPDALPHVRSISAGPSFLAWILVSDNPFPKLTVIKIRLWGLSKAKMWNTYHTTLRGLARLPTVAALVLDLGNNFYPWDPSHFDPATAPELKVSHVVRLQICFFEVVRKKRTILSTVEWLRTFPSVREVELAAEVQVDRDFEKWCRLRLDRELPEIQFTFRFTLYVPPDYGD